MIWNTLNSIHPIFHLGEFYFSYLHWYNTLWKVLSQWLHYSYSPECVYKCFVRLLFFVKKKLTTMTTFIQFICRVCFQKSFKITFHWQSFGTFVVLIGLSPVNIFITSICTEIAIKAQVSCMDPKNCNHCDCERPHYCIN